MRIWINLIEGFQATSGAASEPALHMLLEPKGMCSAMGKESGTLRPTGISRLTNAHGATRYLYCEDGRALSVLQIVSKDGITGLIANVYTAAEARRRGLATALMTRARKDFKEIHHSDDLSPDGAAWANSVG